MKRFCSISIAFFASLLFLTTVSVSDEPRGSLRGLCVIPSDFDWDFVTSDSQFLGVWDGAWGQNGELEHTLIVYNLDASRISAYYATSDYEPWDASPSCYNVEGEITGVGTMQFRFTSIGTIAEYELLPDGSLKGTYTLGAAKTPGTFSKQ